MGTHGFISVVCSLALLAGVALERGLRPKPEDTAAYHEAVRLAAEAFPMTIGDWEGQDTEVPESAIALLKPNAIISRKYLNRSTGHRVDFLIVHCRQAGDMAGHYPPICYPNTGGWELKDTRSMSWRSRHLEVPGIEYDFYQSLPGQSRHLTVANVLALPDGSTAQSMEGVRAIAADYLQRYYGAGQLQMLFFGNVLPEDRVEIFEQFLDEVYPVLHAIYAGEK